MSPTSRPVARYAFYGALFGSLFGVAAPAAGGPERVVMITGLSPALPLGVRLAATLIPVLMCTVWSVAVATRRWPLAGIVGFTLGRMLVDPLLGLMHVQYGLGVHVQEAAGLLVAALGMVAAGLRLPPRLRTP